RAESSWTLCRSTAPVNHSSTYTSPCPALPLFLAMSYANVFSPGSRGHSDSGTSGPRRNHLTLPLSDHTSTDGNDPYRTSRIAVAVRLVSNRVARPDAVSIVIDRSLLAGSNITRGSNRSAAY